ncbi:MAG TPA: hypothetical protein VLI06_15690 [Solimonas sp.]|nr:hypothetical protein [Solimonas sp.]
MISRRLDIKDRHVALLKHLADDAHAPRVVELPEDVHTDDLMMLGGLGLIEVDPQGMLHLTRRGLNYLQADP